jgi:hypothetical protein
MNGAQKDSENGEPLLGAIQIYLGFLKCAV